MAAEWSPTSIKPELRFEIVGVYRGESTWVINYRNHRGELVNEVLTFDGGGLVREGHIGSCGPNRMTDKEADVSRNIAFNGMSRDEDRRAGDVKRGAARGLRNSIETTLRIPSELPTTAHQRLTRLR